MLPFLPSKAIDLPADKAQETETHNRDKKKKKHVRTESITSKYKLELMKWCVIHHCSCNPAQSDGYPERLLQLKRAKVRKMIKLWGLVWIEGCGSLWSGGYGGF